MLEIDIAFFKGSSTSKTRKYLMCCVQVGTLPLWMEGYTFGGSAFSHYPKVEAVLHTLCRTAANNYLKGKGTRGFSPIPRLIKYPMSQKDFYQFDIYVVST